MKQSKPLGSLGPGDYGSAGDGYLYGLSEGLITGASHIIRIGPDPNFREDKMVIVEATKP